MIALRVPPKIKKILETLAKGERRPLANFCYNAVADYVKRKYNIDIEEHEKDD